jgi:type II secretory pathway predicted ATPase ExeA
MYQDFYRLSDNPFALLPDPRFFFASRAHRRAIAYMRFGLRQGEGFIVITGEVGVGKSMVAAQLLEEIDPRTFQPVHIATSQLGAAAALRLIASGLGIDPGGGDKDGTLSAIEDALAARRNEGRRALLMIDEAQNLPFETLEELRMLSNLHRDGVALLQCFILAQPQFAARLSSPRLEQLRQRVVASCRIECLSRAETRGYVEHRLTTAGWQGDPEFTPRALARLHAAAEGIPRRINALCSRLLFFGALEQLHRIDARAVETVVRDLSAEVAARPGVVEGEEPRLGRGAATLQEIIRAQSRAIHHLAAALAAASAALPEAGDLVPAEGNDHDVAVEPLPLGGLEPDSPSAHGEQEGEGQDGPSERQTDRLWRRHFTIARRSS